MVAKIIEAQLQGAEGNYGVEVTISGMKSERYGEEQPFTPDIVPLPWTTT